MSLPLFAFNYKNMNCYCTRKLVLCKKRQHLVNLEIVKFRTGKIYIPYGWFTRAREGFIKINLSRIWEVTCLSGILSVLSFGINAKGRWTVLQRQIIIKTCKVITAKKLYSNVSNRTFNRQKSHQIGEHAGKSNLLEVFLKHRNYYWNE